MSEHLQSKAVVLVVEDDTVLRKIVIELIKAGGFDVLEAANADEAIDILEHHAEIRIIFTDIDMPGSMDGISLASAVRGRWPPIEIIITSGRRRLHDFELPPRGVFLSKPYDGDKLVKTLKMMAARALDHSGSAWTFAEPSPPFPRVASFVEARLNWTKITGFLSMAKRPSV